MKVIAIVVIALALVSVSKTNQISFGEFVEGQNQGALVREFIITGSSDAKFNRDVEKYKQIIKVTTAQSLAYFSPCNTCTKLKNQTKPSCTKKACNSEQSYIQDFVYNLISKQYAASEFWKAPARGSSKFVAGKKWISFVPLK